MATRSLEQYEVPHAPVRDDDALGPTEDLDREPDGAPHSVIGFTALFSAMLALLVALMFATGSHLAALLIVAIAIPVLVSTLRRKAARDRDQLHPAR